MADRDYPWPLLAVAWSKRGAPLGECPAVCSSDGCINVARWECFWPGQTCDKCHACREKLTAVAKALGFDLQAKAIDVAIGDDDTSIRASLLELD